MPPIIESKTSVGLSFNRYMTQIIEMGENHKTDFFLKAILLKTFWVNHPRDICGRVEKSFLWEVWLKSDFFGT